MKSRPAFKMAVALFGGLVLTPFLQAPAVKLAEKLHFDTALSDRWGPLMQWLSDLTQTPWYIFSAGVAVGAPLALWVDYLLRERSRREESASLLKLAGNRTKPSRTLLRVRFTGEMEAPHSLSEENVLSWFAYWSPGARAADQCGNTLFEAPSSWAIFIDFKEPISYHQIVVGFTGGRPHSYEVRQSLTTSAVITFTGAIPACEMEAVTRGPPNGRLDLS